jgi:tetratricopeptide (TPR) repeat protein
MPRSTEPDRQPNKPRVLSRGPNPREVLGWVWAILGVVATIGGVVTFFALDVPALLKRGGSDSPSVRPAAEDEVLVIVTGFSGDPELDTDTRIYRTLHERAAESGLENVRVEFAEEQTPLIAEDAVALGEQAGATIVIWGSVTASGIEPRYEVVRNADLIRRQADLGVATADLPTFHSVIYVDTPNEFEYLMLFSLGQMAYFSGDYAGAVRLLREAAAVPLDPARSASLGLPTVYFYLGYAASATGSLSDALDAYTFTIALTPGDYNAYYNRALIYYEMDRYAEALADLNQAIALNSQDGRFFANRGVIHAALGDEQAALDDYTRAIVLRPDSVTALNNRGLIFYQQGDLARALADFDAGLAADPENADLYNNRAYAAAALGGDLDQALEDADQATRLEPENGNFMDTLAFVYVRRGEYDRAVVSATRAIELGETLSYYTRGLAFEALEDVEAAVEDYHQFLAYYAASGGPAVSDAQARLAALSAVSP